MASAEEFKVGLPIKCELEKDCYIQSLPDLLETEETADSFCQGATYDGHKGVDIRLLSLKDIKRNVAVIAPASGTIKVVRDGLKDILMTTPQDRERVKGKECGNDVTSTAETLFDAETIAYFSENTSRLMASGISGNVIEHKELVRKGAPSQAIKGDEAIVGWAWFINLRQGDQIRFLLEGPNGVISEITTNPLERKKASYSAFSGKRRTVEVGEYKLNTELLRNNEIIAQSLHVHIVE